MNLLHIYSINLHPSIVVIGYESAYALYIGSKRLRTSLLMDIYES